MVGDSSVSQVYPRKELGGYRDEASGQEVLLELQRSPRTERKQVVVRKTCLTISSLRSAEGLGFRMRFSFLRAVEFWGCTATAMHAISRRGYWAWSWPTSVNTRMPRPGRAGPSSLGGGRSHSLALLYTSAPESGF